MRLAGGNAGSGQHAARASQALPSLLDLSEGILASYGLG